MDYNLEHLPEDLSFAIKNIYSLAGLKLTTMALPESESFGYGACRFGLNGKNIVFRIAKTTPRKVGQFVTVWKRRKTSEHIVPFDITDGIDFLVISVSDGMAYKGQFVFDQKILLMKDIMSQDDKGGKRGFRLYPPWVKLLSKEALKTQKWQLPYFFSWEGAGVVDLEVVCNLFKQNNSIV
jgi:hypothetical protein